MKKYSVQLASLVLFFAIFASGMVIGMEKKVPDDISEQEAAWLRTVGIRPEILWAKKEDVPQLPADVQKVIWTKVLRLVLDDIQDNPQLLMSREKLEGFRGLLANYVTGESLEWYKSPDNIDFIIKLIMAGADPNTKNYKGNNVLHLLIAGLPTSSELTKEFFDALKLKIYLLTRYKININAQNGAKNTIAHELMKLYVKEDYLSSDLYNLIGFLNILGLDMTSIKNDDQQTPIELGQKLVEAAINKSTDTVSLITKLQNWIKILLLTDKRTKNLYGIMLWKAIENKIKQITNPAEVESTLTALRQLFFYSEFMAKE